VIVGQGPWEIERRYLVRVDPDVWSRVGAGHHYRQGYLKKGSPSVRIRVGEPRGPVLTLKSGNGVRRREVETVVPRDVADGLLKAAGRRVIEKVRHRLGPWELDRFDGALDGLTLLEIELDDEDDPVPKPPAGIHIMREVTNDKRFTSHALARMRKKERRRLVAKVYRNG
jgi:CYTH domain-containing protein